MERNRFDAIDREQLAAQLVAIMDAHFQRPSSAEKRRILVLAGAQISANELSHQIPDSGKTICGPTDGNVVIE
jgi:hypothetical protein